MASRCSWPNGATACRSPRWKCSTSPGRWRTSSCATPRCAASGHRAAGGRRWSARCRPARCSWPPSRPAAAGPCWTPPSSTARRGSSSASRSGGSRESSTSSRTWPCGPRWPRPPQPGPPGRHRDLTRPGSAPRSPARTARRLTWRPHWTRSRCTVAWPSPGNTTPTTTCAAPAPTPRCCWPRGSTAASSKPSSRRGSDMPIDVAGLDLDTLAARVSGWLEEDLPAPWAQGAREGDRRPLGPALAAKATTSAWFAELGDSGLATPGWPAEYGGLGLAADATAVVSDELTRWRAGRPEQDFVGLALGGPTIIEWGAEEQKQRFLRPLARAEHRWCQLFSEPGAGSDLASLRTRAVRRDGAWVVNGQKVWSSYSASADFGLLMARTDPSQPKHRGITYFLLDMHTPGVQVRPLRQLNGHSEV